MTAAPPQPNTPRTVHVVLLNWHGWRDTNNCLDSLAGLTYPDYHILVVDNGSTDKSVDRIRAAHPEVDILETGQNLGFSGGCNVGTRKALEDGADYIWLLNNDTTVDSQSLSEMILLAESDSEIAAVGSVIYYMDEPDKIQAWGGGWVSFWNGRGGHHKSPVYADKLHYLTGTSMLIRRKTLEEQGLLDEQSYFMYWEDTDFSFRIRRAGLKIAVAPKAKIYHKESASAGKNSPLQNYHFNRSAVRFFRKHAPIPAWPIMTGVFLRLAKRLLHGEKTGFINAKNGLIAGLKNNPCSNQTKN